MMSTGAEFDTVEIGYMARNTLCRRTAQGGEVGYITPRQDRADTRSAIRSPRRNVGREGDARLPQANPMSMPAIFRSTAPIPDLRDALEKMTLNDASLSFEPDSSAALGFASAWISSACSIWRSSLSGSSASMGSPHHPREVIYRLHLTDGTTVELDNPTNYPDPATIESARNLLTRRSDPTRTSQHHGSVRAAPPHL
jgi:GTP-binding protein LepA